MVCVLYKNLKYKLKTTVDPARLIGVDRSLGALSDPWYHFIFFFAIFLLPSPFFVIFFVLSFLSFLLRRRGREIDAAKHRSTPLGACG